MRPIIVLLFLEAILLRGISTEICSTAEDTLTFEPLSSLISVTQEDENKRLLFVDGNSEEYVFQCNSDSKTIRLSDLSYADHLNYKKMEVECGKNCSTDMIVLGPNASGLVNCTSNGTRLSCDTQGVLDIAFPERSIYTSVKYSFYESSTETWIQCDEYDANSNKIDYLNQLSILETTIIVCPFNRSIHTGKNVLVRLEKSDVTKIGLGVLLFNGGRSKRSSMYSYITVKITASVPAENGKEKGFVRTVAVVVVGTLLGACLIVFVGGLLIFRMYNIKKKQFKLDTLRNPNKIADGASYISSSKYSETDTVSTALPDYDGVLVFDDAGKRRILRRQLSGDPRKFNPDVYLNSQAGALSYDPVYEVSRSEFIVGKMLGSGNFGSVYEGEVYKLFGPNSRTKVAIKTVNDSTDVSRLTALLCEIKILGKTEPNLNLVSMLGACVAGLENDGELFLLLEYCPYGDLKSYLIEKRSQFRSIEDEGRRRLLTDWSYGIARGMEYLNSRRIMHGDLAARNILLGHDLVAKVSDFGLSKTMYDKYRYRKTNRQYVPWKWMAMEYLQDGCFHINSDAWSYGVVLWEIYSLGEEPYVGEKIDAIVERLRKGYRLTIPVLLNAESDGNVIYESIMKPAWTEEPKSRITFSEIISIFEAEILTEEELQVHEDRSKRYQELDKARKTKAENSKGSYSRVFSLIDDNTPTPETEDPLPDSNGYISVQMANQFS